MFRIEIRSLEIQLICKLIHTVNGNLELKFCLELKFSLELKKISKKRSNGRCKNYYQFRPICMKTSEVREFFVCSFSFFVCKPKVGGLFYMGGNWICQPSQILLGRYNWRKYFCISKLLTDSQKYGNQSWNSWL